MFRNVKLSVKLIVAFLVVGVIPFAVIGVTSLLKSSEALSKQTFGQLESLREIKKAQIENYFEQRKSDMNVMVETMANLKQAAVDKLVAVQEIKKAEIEKYMADRFKDINVLATNSVVLEALTSFSVVIKTEEGKTDSAIWKYTEFKFGDTLSSFKDKYGYEDLYLISKEGVISYTVNKGPDLAQNVVTGELQKSPLGKCFKRALEAPATADFEPYAPAKNQQAAFIGAPLFKEKELVGVVALRLPTKAINEIVQRREGMGKSGESFLVGKHNGKISFRSNMKTEGDGKYVIGYEISAPYIQDALNGKTAQGVFTDNSGTLVLAAYNPLEISGFNWACVSKIDLEETIASKVQGDQEDYLTKYIQKYGFYDLALIHPNGKVFYTVKHEADYGTNMIAGEHAGSNLGKLVQKVLETKEYSFADFKPYAPSNNEPAAFIAQPVVNNGNVELVVALHLSLDSINGIMQQRAGMGKTGETYLVGPDKLMRSDSFMDATHRTVKASFADPTKGSVDTVASNQALGGKTGEVIATDYNGRDVLSAYTPITIGDTTWALISEISKSEAFAAIEKIKWLIGLVAAIGIAAIIFVALFVARAITKPINRVIGGLSMGADQVASASGQMTSASQSLAEGASEQAASLEETSSSMEEMSSMTRQNAENAVEANRMMVEEASENYKMIGERMKKMQKAMDEAVSSSEETAKIIKTIDEIAFQTNLLALNAAVEAARAGEAGAGFAVVADEVRNLAMRAAEAAKNTSNLIEVANKQINQSTQIYGEVAEAIDQNEQVGGKVAQLISDVAAASQEQQNGIEQVNKAINEMDKVTQKNAANAEESASSAEEMKSQAEKMKENVESLIALVGGSRNEKRKQASLPTKREETRKKLPASAANEKGKKPMVAHHKKEVNPSDVIPFEDEKLSDF